MALDATKWSVSTGKAIRYIGPAHGVSGANYVTVLEMHRWLQDLADDASSVSDDYMDITRDTPTDKSFDTIINLINSYTLDTAYTTPADEYIYGGSIISGGGTDIWDGVAVVANRGCYVDVIQNNARITNDFWNQTPSGEAVRGINFDAATGKSAQFMVKVRTGGADIEALVIPDPRVRQDLFRVPHSGYRPGRERRAFDLRQRLEQHHIVWNGRYLDHDCQSHGRLQRYRREQRCGQ